MNLHINRFRLFAVDHGMFSFIDESHGTWPLVLITNPKNGQFNMPNFEPKDMVLKSTHIRYQIQSLFIDYKLIYRVTKRKIFLLEYSSL